MEVGDEVEITITVRIIPDGNVWKDGQYQTTKHMRLPVKLLDYNRLNRYILDLEQEIEHGIQTTD